MYGPFLKTLMRLSGQIAPSELRALGHQTPSSATHLVHNLFILVAIGGTLLYGEVSTYEKTIENSKGKKVAYLVMTGLAKIWCAAAFFFLVIRITIFHKSYSKLTPILNSDTIFEMYRFRGEKRFRWVLSVFLTILSGIRILYVFSNLGSFGNFWGLLESISLTLSNIYLMLFAAKLVFLTRLVRFNFQVANRFLRRNIIKRQKKFFGAPKDELDVLLNLHWRAYGFVDVLNDMFGLELAAVVSYFYVGILKYLYYASISSALFSADDPDWSKLAVDLVLASQDIFMSLIVMGNGSLLTKEAKATLELVWNSVPDIQNENSKRKLISFASHVSQLPNNLTAHGIFILNMKTFCNIITSLATQLVILISMGNE